jgi:hypothetical protein
LRIYLGLFALVLLAALGRAEPAAAQECDPTVCANPLAAGATARHHRHRHHTAKTKHRKTPKERPQYLKY